jgi:glycosyltransferase involved in cell wall biosynthesis
MRIALVSQEYPPETAKGGIGSQTYLKAHGLAALGHEVEVISRTLQAQRTESLDQEVRVTRVPGLSTRMAVHTEVADWLGYSVEVAAAIAAVHARAPLDLVDFPEWGAEGYLHLLNRTEWNRIPTVIQLHGPLVMFAHTMDWPDKDSEFYRVGTMMEGACLRLADAVYTSSQCSADWCATHYSLQLDRVPVLHTGVDTERFAPRNLPKSKRPTILFSGKLARNKGVALLVEAACRLARDFPDLHLRLFGRGEPEFVSEIHAIANAAGLSDLLDLPGFIGAHELSEHLSRAHVFAAPSRYEGGPGLVYLEAMACGLPVIACAGSGVAEIIRQGENGLLVPPEDVDALTDVLGALLEHPDRRQAMGERARRYVIEEADTRVCLKRLEAFYQSVVTGGTP